MKITVEFKHKTQVGNGVITASNSIKAILTGSLLSYWNRYKDEMALDFLSKKLLEAEYPTKHMDLIITHRYVTG